MRIIVMSLFLVCSLVAFGQKDSVRIYTDTSGRLVSETNAHHYVDIIKQGKVYKATAYYKGSNRLYGRGMYSDSTISKGIGIEQQYYESGVLKDSILYDQQGHPGIQYSFHENGKLHKRTTVNRMSFATRIEEYDDNGRINPKLTVVQFPPQFRDGLPGWVEFLEKNLKADIPVRKKAPAGKYTVVVSFIVDEDGRVKNISADNDPGYGTREEAIRVLEKSPKWQPATKNGQPVVYNHKQSITFQVTEQ
jgi:hypothetical protein